jgi:hypothetical protein
MEIIKRTEAAEKAYRFSMSSKAKKDFVFSHHLSAPLSVSRVGVAFYGRSLPL